MTLIDRLGGELPRGRVTVELDDIQATVLRYRPEPYYGTHVMLHVDDARAGRELLRSLTPHVDSAAEWWQAGEPWIAVAITYSGLVALGVPEDSLQSFPEAFRVGMAARAGRAPRPRRERPEALGAAVRERAHPHRCQRLQRLRGDVASHDGLGAAALRGMLRAHGACRRRTSAPSPATSTRSGYKDSIGQPAIEGSGVEPLPGQGPAIKAGEFILGYPGEAGVPLPAPRPDVLGRNGTSSGCASTSRASATFNRFLQAHAQTDDERELLAAKLVGRWRSGAPLTLAPTHDDPALGADPLRNNDFTYAADPRRPAGAARLAHAAHEPARHQDGAPHRRQHPPHHPARHDLRRALRPERDSRSRTTRPPRASTSSSSAPRRWPRWSSCSRSGSTTATS